ncbi:hypothetical protein GGX14DRAFT_385551 [Mycena pura]|uniref:Uncharacterized protein n=1 Tax=Mycena pura TaxID=153505 RepID=A0AAD6YQS7_9AGAR|nr:hypothetical protein GGX14DRAFT_385551 [Mycena pura]
MCLRALFYLLDVLPLTSYHPTQSTGLNSPQTIHDLRNLTGYGPRALTAYTESPRRLLILATPILKSSSVSKYPLRHVLQQRAWWPAADANGGHPLARAHRLPGASIAVPCLQQLPAVESFRSVRRQHTGSAALATPRPRYGSTYGEVECMDNDDTKTRDVAIQDADYIRSAAARGRTLTTLRNRKCAPATAPFVSAPPPHVVIAVIAVLRHRAYHVHARTHLRDVTDAAFFAISQVGLVAAPRLGYGQAGSARRVDAVLASLYGGIVAASSAFQTTRSYIRTHATVLASLTYPIAPLRREAHVPHRLSVRPYVYLFMHDSAAHRHRVAPQLQTHRNPAALHHGDPARADDADRRVPHVSGISRLHTRDIDASVADAWADLLVPRCARSTATRTTSTLTAARVALWQVTHLPDSADAVRTQGETT